MKTFLVLLAILTASVPAVLAASSPDAWDQFRAEIRTQALAAVSDALADPVVVVDTYGSDSYGAAFVIGRDKQDDTTRIFFYVYDKKSKKGELTNGLALDDPQLMASLKKYVK